MPSDYETHDDGEWFEPKPKGWRHMCCDCSLVHTVNFRVRNGKIEAQFTRHDRATAAARRKQKR